MTAAGLPEKSLRLAVYALPFAFALHNLEELEGMEKWSHNVNSYVHAPVTTPQFGFAVGVFTILGFLLVFSRIRTALYVPFVCGFSGMLFLNVFFPHLAASILFGSLAPGVVTGVLINAPLSAFIWQRLIKLGLISKTRAALSALAGGGTGALLAALLLRLGAMITG